jgi:hypothetical protein
MSAGTIALLGPTTVEKQPRLVAAALEGPLLGAHWLALA